MEAIVLVGGGANDGAGAEDGNMTMAGDALSLRQLMKARILTLKRMTIKGENLHPVMGINRIPRDNPKEGEI
jgi:hypothetical protein